MTNYPGWLTLAAPAAALLISGCSTPKQAYYVSPFNGNNSEYHPIPKQGDSVHAAVYGNFSFFKGNANYSGIDDYWGMNSSVYAAHSYTNLQFYYGATLSLGSYDMGHWTGAQPTPGGYTSGNPEQLNLLTGGHSFGGLGFQGGINAVIPIPIGEWRLLGVETSVMHEFGNYLSVRQHMPDSIATMVIRSATFATVGASSELVGHTREGEFGFRWSYGVALGNEYINPGVYDLSSGSTLHYTYFTFSFHYTYQRMTGFLMLNQATKSSGWQTGVNFQLWGAKRKSGDAPPEYPGDPRSR